MAREPKPIQPERQRAPGAARVLVVDDDDTVRWSLRQGLESAGYAVTEAATGAEGLLRAQQGTDVILLDCRLPDMDGVTMLPQIRRQDASRPVIVMTAHSSIEHAVEAMRAGASDYLTKPFDLEVAVRRIEHLLRMNHVAREYRVTAQGDTPALSSMIGDSAAMSRVKRVIRKVGATQSSTVLITGERNWEGFGSEGHPCPKCAVGASVRERALFCTAGVTAGE